MSNIAHADIFDGTKKQRLEIALSEKGRKGIKKEEKGLKRF